MSEASCDGRYSRHRRARSTRHSAAARLPCSELTQHDYASRRMAQRHLDRLTALDASFLHQEGPESHMHIGALTTFDGPPPTFDELIELIGSRLHLVPRYRQRLAHTPLDRGRPVWVDDAAFRLEYHVRHVALPEPGDRDQLLTLLSRIFSTQLDRRRPLWEVWFVEGLAGGGFAFIFKTHHAVIDGVAGVDLATVIFDLESEGEPEPEPPAIGLDARSQAGPARAARARRRPRRARRPRPTDRGARRRRASAARRAPPARRRGRGRRDRLGGAEPGPGHAAQRADRPAPALRHRRRPAGGLQNDQERLWRHGQRRGACGRERGAA